MGIPMFIRDSYVNFLAGLGMPGRDKAASGGVMFNYLGRGELDTLFRSDWIARKIIDIPAKDATREWRAWEAEANTVEKIEELEKGLDLQNKIKKAMILNRLYGGSALLLGVAEGEPAEELRIDRVGKDALKFVHVLNRHQLSLGEFETDLSSPYFGSPRYFNANTMAASVATRQNSREKPVSLAGVQIHPSRVIVMRGAYVPEDSLGGTTHDAFWGDSILQVINDAVMAAGLVTGSIATLVSEAKMDIIKIPELSRQIASQAYQDRLTTRFAFANASKSVINTLLLDKEEEWQRIETQFSALPDILKLYLLIASGAADIPATRMLGQSPVGLQATGDNDVRNYYDRVSSDQKGELTPALTPLDEIVIRSAIGTRDPSIYYEWNSLWQMTDAEKADIAVKKAGVAKSDSEMGLIDPEALRIGRQNQLIEDGTYPGLEVALEQQQELDEGSMLTPEEQDAEALDRQKKTMELLAKASPPPGPGAKPPANGGGTPKKAVPFDSSEDDRDGGIYIIAGDYNPDQPRAEAGSPEGGQWVSGESGTGLSPEVTAGIKAAGGKSYTSIGIDKNAGTMKLRGKEFKIIDHPNNLKMIQNLSEINATSFPKSGDFAPYQNSISEYTSSLYSYMNKYLRGNTDNYKYPKTPQAVAMVQKHIPVLDALFERASAASDIVLFRGIGVTGRTVISKSKVGDIIVDPGFGSASGRYGVASNFGTVAEVFVPKGAHVAYLKTSSQGSGEYEALFARDSKFEIVGMDRNASGTFTKLRLLYIPPDQGPVLNTPPVIGAGEEQLPLFGKAPASQASLFEPAVIAKIAATTPPPSPPVAPAYKPIPASELNIAFSYKESKVRNISVNGEHLGTSAALPDGTFKITTNEGVVHNVSKEKAKDKIAELYNAKKAAEPPAVVTPQGAPVEFKPTSEAGVYDVHVGTLKVAQVKATANGTGWELTTIAGNKFKYGTYADVNAKAQALAASAKAVGVALMAKKAGEVQWSATAAKNQFDIHVAGVKIGLASQNNAGNWQLVAGGKTHLLSSEKAVEEKAIEVAKELAAKKAAKEPEPEVETAPSAAAKWEQTVSKGGTGWKINVGGVTTGIATAAKTGTGWKFATSYGTFDLKNSMDVEAKALEIAAHEEKQAQVSATTTTKTSPIAPSAGKMIASSAAKLAIGAKNTSGWRPIRVNGKVIGIARWDKGSGAQLQLQGNDPPLKFPTLQAMKKAVEEKGWPPVWHSQYKA